MICPKCLNDCGEAAFCSECGTRLEKVSQNDVNSAVLKEEAEHTQRDEQGAPPEVPPVVGAYSPNYSTPFSQDRDTSALSTGDFVLLHLINRIPLVRLVMWFVWGFSQDCNLNRRNWARAELIWLLINIGLFVVGIIVFASSAALFAASGGLFDWLENLMNSL